MMDEKKFIELYERHKNSGLNIKDFCSNELIAPSTFHYWKKKLKEQNSLPDFIPIIINPHKKSGQLSFQDNSHLPSSAQQNHNTPIELEFPNGIIVRIQKDIDLKTLSTLIHLYD